MSAPKNTQYVETKTSTTGFSSIPNVTADNSLAQIQDARKKAASDVAVSKKEITEITKSEGGGHSAPAGNSDAKLYGDIITELVAPGAKLVTAALEIADERILNKNGSSSDTTNSAPLDIEDYIAKANDEPGVYKARETGRDIVADANITSSSLGQPKECVGTWDAPENAKMAGVEQVKQMTLAMELKNKMALGMAIRAENEYGQNAYAANQKASMHMAPGIGGMANGPRFSSNILNEPEQTQIGTAA